MNRNDATFDSSIAERAAEWFVLHRSGEPSAAQCEAFAEWLRESPVHIREYLAISSTSSELSKALQNSGFEFNESEPASMDNVVALPNAAWPNNFDASVESTHAQRPRRRRWAVAASIAVLAVVGSWFALESSDPSTVYATTKGEQRAILLHDGSMLYVNSDTEVKVSYSPAERRITLERGQALFRVAHDAARPFRVAAGGAVAVAIGTQFDVRRDHSTTVVTVLEGRVALDRPVADRAGQVHARHRRLELSPGQQAEVAASDGRVRVAQVDLQDYTAWPHHRIVFDRQPLAAVVREFNLYSRMRIDIGDPRLGELKVSGVFDYYDVESFIDFLRQLDGVEAVTTEDRVVIKPRPRAAFRDLSVNAPNDEE